MQEYGHPPKTRIELFMEGREYHESEQQLRYEGGCSHSNDGESRRVKGDSSTSNHSNQLSTK